MVTRGGVLSRASMYGSFTVVVIAVFLTWSQQSSKYWPLLVIGFAGGCVSTPFYYYFKSRQKLNDPYLGADVKALGDYAQYTAKKERQGK